MLKRWKKKK